MPTLYMNASKQQIADYVLLTGDPWRVDVLKKYLDDAQGIAHLREYNTITGHYKGVRVTATSTGIGGPSAAIAMEEMYECGMKVAVRMGTLMALDESMLGHFMIPLASLRREGTSLTYVEAGYPAVADLDLVNALNAAVSAFGKQYRNGIACSMDGFYRTMKESRYSKQRGEDLQKIFDDLRSINVAGIDMESSCMLTVGRLMGVKTAVITMVTVLENLKEKLIGDSRIQAEDLLCRAALEGIARYAKASKDNK